MDLKKFIAELQRRHVGRVAGFYLVAGWVIIQVVATIFPLMGLTPAAQKVVLILIALGFPVAVVLAWVFDITPRGVQRTDAVPAGQVAAPRQEGYSRAVAFFGVGILVALVAFAALSRVRDDRHRATASGIRSIAVLPFVDMSEKQDQAYFTDGISEEVLNRLAQIPDLKVPARTSSFSFRGTTLDIQSIAERLKVEAVLEGSVRREGDQVRVTARLIDARTQNKLWDKDYDKQISSVFAIQDEIATDIVRELSLKIDPKPLQAAPGMANVNAKPAAVDAYMKALHLFNKRTDPALRQAAIAFEDAVRRDSSFAEAYAMLAQTYAVLPAYGDFPPFEASTKGQAAAAHALELNPNLAEAYAALGQIRQNFEWDFESAERSYRRAILFNNGYATAHEWRAEALLMLGEFAESQAEVATALDLDPASPAALHVKAYQHIVKHEFPAANRILDRILASNPDYILAVINKAALSVMTGQGSAARDLFARIAGHDPSLNAAFNAVIAAAQDPAKRPDAKRALSAIEKRRAPSEMALWYALAGLNDDALALIKRAYESGADANLPFVLLHPALDPVRSTKDYQSILSDLHMTAP